MGTKNGRTNFRLLYTICFCFCISQMTSTITEPRHKTCVVDSRIFKRLPFISNKLCPILLLAFLLLYINSNTTTPPPQQNALKSPQKVPYQKVLRILSQYNLKLFQTDFLQISYLQKKKNSVNISSQFTFKKINFLYFQHTLTLHTK